MGRYPQGPFRKSWCWGNIYGTSRHDSGFTQSVRGVWNDLLDFAKLCADSGRVTPGVIAPGEATGYSHEYLANLLNTPLEEFRNAIEVLVRTERIEENHTGIRIINWEKYQPPYDRIKKWRAEKKEKDYTGKGTKYEEVMKAHAERAKTKNDKIKPD